MTLASQAAVFLGAIVVVVPVFRRLGLSSILGYLTAGVAMGPWGLRVELDRRPLLEHEALRHDEDKLIQSAQRAARWEFE